MFLLDGMKLGATSSDKSNNNGGCDDFQIFHLIEAIPEFSGFIGFRYVHLCAVYKFVFSTC